MEQEQIIEGNKLIAEFMGLQVIELNGDLCHYKSMFTVEYHTSWDWLMPVVEKIESLGLKCEIGISSCTFYSAKYNVERTYAGTKIQAVWIAVVEFIKWQNQNP